MTPATDTRYSRREATGRIEQVNPGGLKLDGLWWDNSRRQPIDLSAFNAGDLVRVAASETADGEKRWLLEIQRLDASKPRPSRPPVQFVDDMPDWPDDAEGAPPAVDRQRVADRLACLQIAAGILTLWWAKSGADPDPVLVLGIADQLVAWVHRAPADDLS